MLTKEDEERIAREEAAWNAPRFFISGFLFLGACLVLLQVMAAINNPNGFSLLWWR
jgi:hypothetical protein